MASTLTQKHCAPCEGKVASLAAAEVRELQQQTPEWQVTAPGTHIRRAWRMKNFVAALDFFRRVGDVAEAENHHPDLHLTGYRDVVIEISTHAVKGLTENDFILAAKIDALPVEGK